MTEQAQSNHTPGHPVPPMGSIERGVAGDYELTIGGTMAEAWEATKGNKWLLNLALGVYSVVLLVYIAITAIVRLLTGAGGDEIDGGFSVFTLLIDLAFYGVSGLLATGLYVIAARVSMGQRPEVMEIFAFKGQFVKSLLTYILMALMIVLGFLLLVVPGIYLSIAYMLAIPLAVEKNLSPWQALETSRKAISKKWFTVFFLTLAIGLLLAITGILTLGIAWIWLGPMALLVYGILYRSVFGIEGAAVG